MTSPVVTRSIDEEASSPTPRCLACGSGRVVYWASARDVEYATSADLFSYYRCSSCDALFIDPVPDRRLAEIYPPNYYSYAAPGASFVQAAKSWLDRRFFRQLLSRFRGKSLHVLDVGGGAGWELRQLRESDTRVESTTVVDLDAGAAELARANGHRYFCGRIEDYQSSERFDVILMLNLIEHVKEPGLVLRKAEALLSAGGLLVIKTPNYDSLDARIFRNHSWAGYHCPRHWVLFTRPSFEALATRAGLAVCAFSYTQGAPFWAASVLAWLAKNSMVRVSPERAVVFHPLFNWLALLFAAFDFARRPFAKTSQMFFVLTPKLKAESLPAPSAA